jgi:hypothetical protein
MGENCKTLAKTDAILNAFDFKTDPVRGLLQLAQAEEVATQVEECSPHRACLQTMGIFSSGYHGDDSALPTLVQSSNLNLGIRSVDVG